MGSVMTAQQHNSVLSPPGDDNTQMSSFTDNTRFFELTVDFYADSLSLLAFGGDVIGNLPPKKLVAVNGQIDNEEAFFKSMFIWTFSAIDEVEAPVNPKPQDWLLLNANDQ